MLLARRSIAIVSGALILVFVAATSAAEPKATAASKTASEPKMAFGWHALKGRG
jgi:hypothetical protein